MDRGIYAGDLSEVGEGVGKVEVRWGSIGYWIFTPRESKSLILGIYRQRVGHGWIDVRQRFVLK